MGVNFYFLATISLKKRKSLKLFIRHIIEQEGKLLESLTYIFCPDKYLLEINQKYLNHNYFTDIITFDLVNNPRLPIHGEIYISTERVKENASTYKVQLAQELHRVVFHGVLHLCGYMDKTEAQKMVMTQKENEYLKAFELFHVEHI